MSGQKLQRKTSLITVVIIVAAAIASGLLIFYKQQIIDTVRASQFSPSSRVVELRDSLRLTSLGYLYFNSSKPEVEPRERFNQNCPHSAPDSPILGCYSNQLIYVFDVKNERLSGIEETTAAHELLHAAYERMSDSERKEIDSELRDVYGTVKNKELETRMAYYEENEPGEETNELHSILGTEFIQLGTKLESHYKKYFTDRSVIFSYYQKYEKVFSSVKLRLDSLVTTINTRTTKVNKDIVNLNKDQSKLNQDISLFESRSFTSQSDLDTERSNLIVRQDELKDRESKLRKEISAIKVIRKEYDKLRQDYNELSESINSSVKPAPTLK